jgi:hypothetical protein
MTMERIDIILMVMFEQETLTLDSVQTAGYFIADILKEDGRKRYSDLVGKLSQEDQKVVTGYDDILTEVADPKFVFDITFEEWGFRMLNQVGPHGGQHKSRRQVLNGKYAPIIQVLEAAGVYRNKFNCRVYQNLKPLTDQHLADMIITLDEKGVNANPSQIRTALESSKIPQRNPILEFFTNAERDQSYSAVQAIFNSLVLEGGVDLDLLLMFFRRFLLQLVASVHDEGTLRLVPVLIGPSHTGKSTFWRKLLPLELQEDYYSESELDQGKDSKILLSERLLINIDEFGGLAKERVELFKYITSAVKFTERRAYGMYNQDYPRRAVLCGTSNSREVINDTATQNTRIIPIPIVSIDRKKLNAVNREHLIAEIMENYQQTGVEGIEPTPKELSQLDKLSRDFMVIHAVDEEVRDHVLPGSNFEPTSVIMRHLQTKGISIYTQGLTNALRNMGCVSKRQRVNGSNPVRGWMVKLI